MALLGNFDDEGVLQFKDVLIAEQEELATALLQLVVKEGIVIGLPGDLGKSELGAESTDVIEERRDLATWLWASRCRARHRPKKSPR